MKEFSEFDWEAGNEPMRFYVLLSAVCRGYLSRRWDLPAEECTQQELFPILKDLDFIPDEYRQEIIVFLGEADMAKFADVFMPVNKRIDAFKMINEFIAQTKEQDEEELEEVDAGTVQ
jgi:hypothetical protein